MGKFLLVMLGVLFVPAAGLAQTTLFAGVGRGSGENPGAILTFDQVNGTATVIGARAQAIRRRVSPGSPSTPPGACLRRRSMLPCSAGRPSAR